MITHEQEAAEFAQRIVSIRDGVILSDTSDHPQRTGRFHK